MRICCILSAGQSWNLLEISLYFSENILVEVTQYFLFDQHLH